MKTMIVAAAIRKAMSHSSRWSRNLSIPLLPMALKVRADPDMKTPLPRRAPAVALQSYAPKSLRLEAGLLVHRLDDVLADAAFLLAMNDHQRFFPGRLFLRGERDHLRLAGLLHAFERVVI